MVGVGLELGLGLGPFSLPFPKVLANRLNHARACGRSRHGLFTMVIVSLWVLKLDGCSLLYLMFP